MQFRLFKLRFRRKLRHSQRQVEDLGLQAEATLEQHFFKRLSNLGRIRRFIGAWLALMVIMIGGVVVQIASLGNHYQVQQPVAGGSFSEGVLGAFTNANPLFASSEVDTAVSHLVFAGLFKYDDQNKLVGDLASSWQVDDKGTLYTVHLKSNLTWQDGKPLTANDVAFTYHAIQNPDAQSPLAQSWQGITVTKKDAHTITFLLPNPLSSFPETLTNGIVPAHILASMPATDWRSADFNTVHPVGAGPFAWSALQVQHNQDQTEVLIALKPFEHYAGGKPKLGGFVVHAFSDQATMVKDFQTQQLTAIGSSVVPTKLETSKYHQYSFIETAANMVFFNMATPILGDQQVRRALVQGADVPTILDELGYPTKPVREPFLRSQSVYDPAYAQASYNVTAAKSTLQADGWLPGKDGIREKGGKPLAFTLDATNTPEFAKVTTSLRRDWQALGIKVTVQLHDVHEFQGVLTARNYDAVLDGISIGVDPDVFVYWDSSQTDPRSTRLNLSFYKSGTADTALEAGRTRLDPALRAIKYKPFLQDWQQQAPALGLYQPRYLYVTQQQVYGLNEHAINTPIDRFSNVQNWMIHTAKVTQ